MVSLGCTGITPETSECSCALLSTPESSQALRLPLCAPEHAGAFQSVHILLMQINKSILILVDTDGVTNYLSESSANREGASCPNNSSPVISL